MAISEEAKKRLLEAKQTVTNPTEQQSGFSASTQERLQAYKEWGAPVLQQMDDERRAGYEERKALGIDFTAGDSESGRAKYEAAKAGKIATPQSSTQQSTFWDVLDSDEAPNLAPDASLGAKIAKGLWQFGHYSAGGNADTSLPTGLQTDVVQAKQNDPERTLEIGRLSDNDRNEFYRQYDIDPEYAEEWAKKKIAETKANEAESMKAWAKEHPLWGNVASLAPLGATGADIMDIITDVYAGANHYDPFDPLTPTGISQTMREGAKAGSWFGQSGVGQFVDDVLYSSLQSQWSNVVGGGAFEGTGLSSLPLAFYSASAEARTLLQQGYDKREASILATGYGIISFITEAIGSDRIFDKAFKNTAMGEGFKQFGRRLGSIMLKSMASEGVEEGAEDIADWVLEGIVSIINGTDHRTFSEHKANRLEEGRTDAEATALAIWDMFFEFNKDVLSGALSGGLMAGTTTTLAQTGELARNTTSAYKSDKKGTKGDLVSNIKSIAEASGSNYADNIQATDSKFLKKFAENLKIGEAMSRANRDIYVGAIQDRLEQLGIPLEESRAKAEAIYRNAMGGTLSSKEKTLVNDELSKRVLGEIDDRAGWVYNAYATMSRVSDADTPNLTPEGAAVKMQMEQDKVREAYNSLKPLSEEDYLSLAQKYKNEQAISTNAKPPMQGGTNPMDIRANSSERASQYGAQLLGGVRLANEGDREISEDDMWNSLSPNVGISTESLAAAFAKRKEEVSLNRYANAVDLAYNYGKAGMKLADVVRNIGFSMDSALSEAYKNGQGSYVKGLQNNKLRIDRKTANVSYISNEEATKMGVDTVDIASLSDDQNAYIDALDTISKAYGVKMVLFESSGNTKIENGHYDPTTNSIYIDVSSVSGLRKYAILSTAAHELVHDFRRIAPEVYDALRQFVIDKYYGGSETAFNNAAKRIMQQRKLQGFELASPDDAVEELVAMSCEKVFDDPNMISRLAETLESKTTPDGQTMLDKFIEWINGLIERLKSALAKLTGIKANPYAEEMSTKDLEHLRDLFVQAAREIQSTDDGGLSESGIEYDAATDTAMMSTKDIPQNEEEITLAVERLSKKLGVTKAEAREWVESELSTASLILDPKFSDVLDYRGDRRYTAIKKNSDYPQGTLDFSNICRKRRNYTAMMQRLQKRYPNRVFTAEELAEIRQILIDNDIQVACGLCFVEDRRQNETGIAKTFQDAMTSWFAGERDSFNKNQTKALQMLKGGEEIPSIYELTTLEGMQELRAKAPNVADAWEKFNNARGMQSARLLQGEAEYKRQILKYNAARVKRINDLGGLRIFSFSDFEEFHLIDIIQAIQDCAAMGLKIQGYTKVPSFAKLVMDTGTKVNRSLIPKGDLGYRIENGKTVLEYDTTEGIDINDPDFFDSTDNPNIGNILVGINDEQIAAAFLDPFVDYIIPFHTGQRADVLRIKKIGAWKNYKDYQEDKPLPGTTRKKGINIYTEVLDAAEKEGKPITNERQFVEKFLEVCKREGMRPRFSQFLNTDENGDYVYRKGYYKVLLDFKLFDKDGNILPQNPVKPIFDNEYINSILTRYAETKATEERGLAPKMERAYDEIENKLMHSFKGDSLSLGNRRELNIAKKMEEKGKDSESIRLATGWFKGMDGRWRYEIDDSDAKLNTDLVMPNGFIHARTYYDAEWDNLPSRIAKVERNIKEITQKYGKDDSRLINQKNALKELKNRQKEIRDAKYRFNENRFLLTDILAHPALYKAYPQLKNVTVHFSPKSKDGAVGWASGAPKSNTAEITLALDRANADEILSTLMHEVQHIIQNEEGFARGSNIEYEKDLLTTAAKTKAADWMNAAHDAENEAIAKEREYIQEHFPKQVQIRRLYGGDYEGLAKLIRNYTSTMLYAPEADYQSEADGILEAAKKYKRFDQKIFDDIQAAALDFRRNMKQADFIINNVSDEEARARYYRSAGETESRDVQSRLRLTETERENTRPDIDQTDRIVRFSTKDSEGNDLSENQQKYFADSVIRDKDGNLLLMHHGTSADFTEFDREFIGQTGRFEGAGFNFTPSYGRASLYSNKGKVLSGYLNITKPLSATQKTMSVRQLANLIAEIDSTGDNIIVNYAQNTSDYPSKAFVRRESLYTARQIWDYAENDVDIYSEISVASPDSDSIIEKFQSMGYDGAVHYDDNGKLVTAIAFGSNQFKLQTNTNPTGKSDIRYSAKENTIDLTYDPKIDEYIKKANGQFTKGLQNYIFDIFKGKEILFNNGIRAIVKNSDAQHLARESSPMKQAELSNVRDIIRYAKYVGETDHVKTKLNRKGETVEDKFDYYYYYKTKVKYKNLEYYVYLNVGRDRTTHENRFYELNHWDSDEKLKASGGLITMSYPNNRTPSGENIILPIGEDVKTPALKTLNGSVIRRSNYGVGKDMGGQIYVHKNYADEIVPSNVWDKAVELLPDDFSYNTVMYDKKKPSVVRFDEAPDFDTAREPHPGKMLYVDTANGTVKPATGNPNFIWHHKWQWVKNDYEGFDVQESYNWSKEWLKKITNPSGSLKVWNETLEKNGLPLDKKFSTKQEITSEDTSLNQTPSTFTNFQFSSNDRVLDWGGGRYNAAKTAMETVYPGITFEVYDPFNRTESHNQRVLDEFKDKPATKLTINNVLNVIKEESVREDVLRESKQYLADDGVAYILIHPGTTEQQRAGGGVTTKGWQNAKQPSWYLPSVRKFYKNVRIVGSTILASDGPIEYAKMDATTKAKMDVAKVEAKAQRLDMKNSKFSFKGASALDADFDTLNVAEEMETNGYTSEQVRQATGWFKGYDGKWRYEVDDSKARMVDLERKFGEIDSVAKALDEGEYYRIQKFPIHTTLGEILIHPNLYKAYPYLKNTPVIINDGFSNYGIFSQKAAASTDGETITFNYGATNESPLSILMHEIQHMIQTKEGFAKGSSPSTFRSPFYVDNLEGVKEAKARYRTLLNQFKNMSAMALSNARMYEYYNKQKRTDKGLTLQYDLNMIRDVEAVAEKGGYLDLLKDFLAAAQDLEVARAEAADKIDPMDMYMRTAGEIEARDVQARLDLPEWARKNIRPNIDRTDAIKLSTKDDAEYLELAKDPAKNKDKLQAMVDKAAMAAFPNSKLIQDGKFRKMWHFTTAQFNSFKPGKSKNPQGIKGMFFAPTNNGNISSKFGDGKEYYLNVTNPKVPGAKEHNQYAEKIRKMQEGITDAEEIERINRQFIEETGVDGFVDWMNGWYTVLTPEQIKSADPVTYDDDGNIIPLSERFNENSNDIRYSTKDDDEIPYGGKAYLTPERVDTYLKDFAIPDMPNRSQGWIARISPRDFWRSTSNFDTYMWLREDTKPLNPDELKNQRQPIFFDVDLDSDGEPIAITGHEGRHRSMAMANEGIYQEPVILFDYGHWTDNRKGFSVLRLRGQGRNPLDSAVWVYDAIPLDYAHRDAIVEKFATPTKEEQLRERYGIRKTLQYSLKEDLSPNEYLASAVLDNIRKPEDRAGLEEYLNRHKELYQETTKLSNEITDLENKLHDSTVLSDSDRESIENRIKALHKDVRENEKKMWEIVSKPRMQRIIEQQRATIQEYEEEMAKAEEKSDKKIAELRARMDTKVRAEIDKRIAMRKRMLEQQRTQKSRYYYLPRIEKVSKELRKNLEKAPMPFREPIADFLAALDTRTLDAQGNIKDNKANARKTNLIAALNNMSRIAGTTEEWLNKYNVDFNPEMVTWIDDMVEYLSSNRRLLDYYGDINLNTLSADMLEGVYKMVRSLNTTLKNLTKSYTNKALDISEEAKAVMEFDGKLSHGAAEANMAEKIFRWKNAQATTVYQRMGDAGWKMYKLLVKGQSKLAFNEQEIVDFAKSHWKPSDIRKWNDPKKAVKVTIGDEDVMMTPAQMMALYATSRDADGLRHLLEGGGFKLTSQAKGKRTVVDESRVMTEMDLANVINALNEYDPKLIKLTEEIQDFIGKTGAEWGNEVSVARFGYEQFGIENYFPLHTVAADFVGNVIQEDTEAGRFYSMLNRSFTKERTFKANNALVIDGIFDVFANHMSQMALYNAYALPVLDTARFMGWKVNESIDGKPQVTTLGDVWDKAFGKGEMQRYLTNLLDSIAGTKRMDAFEAFALAGLRLHNRVAVAANFRVAAQQPFSITRAFDELDPKHFTIPKNLKALQEEMWRWSGIALWKHQGNYDTNIKGSLASQVMGAKTGFGQFKDDLSEKAMWLAEQGDDYTWAAIWNACKNYISATQPNLTGNAYMEAVTSKFEDVVLLTQVVDTPLQKSEWMREKSFWFKMTSSFKSEPTTSYNMLLRSFDRLSEAKQSGKTGAVWAVVKGPMLRAVGTYVLTALVNSIVTAVIDAARDDDDYETLLDKLKAAFIGDYRGKNFGQWITEFMGSNVGDSINPIKSLPWISDIFSLIEGYDADRADLTIFEEILTQGKAIWTAFTKGDMTYKKVFKLVDGLSKVLGIPLSNVLRDVSAVWNTVFGRIDSTVKLQISPESKQSGYNAFYYAIQNGETVKAMQIVDEIYSNEITSKTAYTGVTNVIREAYKAGKIDKDEALDYMLMTNDYFDRGFDREHIKSQVDGWKQE